MNILVQGYMLSIASEKMYVDIDCEKKLKYHRNEKNH